VFLYDEEIIAVRLFNFIEAGNTMIGSSFDVKNRG